MRRARSISSCGESRSTFPISCKYLSNDWLSRFVYCLLIFTCFQSIIEHLFFPLGVHLYNNQESTDSSLRSIFFPHLSVKRLDAPGRLCLQRSGFIRIQCHGNTTPCLMFAQCKNGGTVDFFVLPENLFFVTLADLNSLTVEAI